MAGIGDAAALEAVRKDPGPADDAGDDVLAEVMAGVRILGVLDQLAGEELRVEHVDAHGCEGPVGLAGNGRGIRRLLDEGYDAVVLIDVRDAEAARRVAGHFEAGDGHVRLVVEVVLEEHLVVHAVDVVAREDEHRLGIRRLDAVEVLVDRVRRAAVPGVLVEALLGRQHVHVLVELARQEGPAELQVLQQAVRVVLREHHDLAEARVHTVGESEVDDAVLAAEVETGLGIVIGQIHQALAAPSSHHERDGVPW